MFISKQCLLSLLSGYSFVFQKHLPKNYISKEYFIENTSFHFNNELKFVYIYKYSKSGLLKDIFELNTLEVYSGDECVLSLKSSSFKDHVNISNLDKEFSKPIGDDKVKDIFMSFTDILLKMEIVE